ncbi:hypothetical protein [Actinomadura nitritigenes]
MEVVLAEMSVTLVSDALRVSPEAVGGSALPAGDVVCPGAAG